MLVGQERRWHHPMMGDAVAFARGNSLALVGVLGIAACASLRDSRDPSMVTTVRSMVATFFRRPREWWLAS